MCEKFHQSSCTLEEYENIRREAINHLRTETTSAERKSWSMLLKEKNSKALWEKVNWNGSVSSHNENEVPDLEDLKDQFQKKSETTDTSTLFSEVKKDQHVPVLDDEITVEEIQIAHKTLKEDKSSADGWVKGMLTNIPVTLLYVFQIIYNSILRFHIYPSKWRTTIVNAIFKNKGTRKLAQYFRGISIVYLMAKVFDIVILNRFKRWFQPHDQQTAYQEKKGCPDHVFLLRCLIAHAKKLKEKLFIISIDFDGAFDRISRRILLQKLSRFGAGTLFMLCIASMYLKTDNIIFQGDEYICYALYAGIKQGLPLSPLLFLFYVNDIFQFFQNSYHNTTNNIYEIIHVLMHADDFTLTASTRPLVLKKLQSLLEFCNLNAIIPQYTKCEFTVINGDENDTEALTFGERLLKHVPHITLLGSHITALGTLKEDLKLHTLARYKSCIKYFNFLKANQLAPLSVKIKVLKGCVVNSVLYNCEIFGNDIPPDIEKQYIKLLKSTFSVRTNTPTLLLYVETGFLPLKAIILARQLKFFKRYKEGLVTNTPRAKLFNRIIAEGNNFVQHYIDLAQKYACKADIYREYSITICNQIRTLAHQDHYKYKIYLQMNPNLEMSPFINNFHPICKQIIRFRLGSHHLPVETGRWSRTARANRLCVDCRVLGDELHALYHCSAVDRSDIVLPGDPGNIWESAGVFKLFQRMKELKLVE